ncbi:MAG: fibronectin type III domain-containing protein [Bifidobacteriaceae bacterium]|nr:fibronectin type III domain-containing protein [Bifidobacteriaceae bacterium]
MVAGLAGSLMVVGATPAARGGESADGRVSAVRGGEVSAARVGEGAVVSAAPPAWGGEGAVAGGGWLAASSGRIGRVEVEVTRRYTLAFDALANLNAQRADLGLDPVTMDRDLLEHAMRRAAESTVRWGHVRPNGREWATAVPPRHKERWWAENLAAGYPTASEAMDAWMTSSVHRPHIVDSRARSVGIGVVAVGSTVYWTQWFSASAPKEVAPAPDGPATTAVRFLTSGFTLRLRAEPAEELAVGDTARLVARLRGPESFKRAVVAAGSLAYAYDADGVARVSGDGVLTALASGDVTVTASVPGAPNLTASVSVRVIGGGVGAPAGEGPVGAPAAPGGVKAAGGASRLTVRWRAVGGASGYTVAYRVKGARAWKTATTKAPAHSRVLKKLRTDTRYQVRVRTVVTAHGTTALSRWSRVAGARTR